jgi:hypothetical protein
MITPTKKKNKFFTKITTKKKDSFPEMIDCIEIDSEDKQIDNNNNSSKKFTPPPSPTSSFFLCLPHITLLFPPALVAWSIRGSTPRLFACEPCFSL